MNTKSFYKSEFTEFLNKYKNENPKIEKLQKTGRKILWDKNLNIDLKNLFIKNK